VAVETDAYPAPRDRGVSAGAGIATASGSSFAAPFTRIWQWRLRVGISQTFNRVVSPAMAGPAVVRTFLLEFSAAPTGGQLPSWMLGYSETPIVELLDSPLPATFPGTKIVETSFQSDGPQALPLPGGSMLGFVSQATGAPVMVLDYIITAPTFYLYFVADAIQNADHSYQGHINVINQLSPEALANFR